MKTEIRLFAPGPLPKSVRAALRGAGSCRTDRYLTWETALGVAIKQRHAGHTRARFETKVLHAQWEEHTEATTLVCQRWTKTLTAEQEVQDCAGVLVRKRRWHGAAGIEVVEMKIGSERWWSASASTRTAPSRKQLVRLGELACDYAMASCSYPQLVFAEDRGTLLQLRRPAHI